MKGDKNPINIFKCWKYRRKNLDKENYCWNGLEVLMGGQGKRKNNFGSTYDHTKIKIIPKSNIYYKC